MRLRDLDLKDVPFMLEWMHDDSVVADLQADFSLKTAEDCKQFIESSHRERECLHLAIADEEDVYLGTVSLKNIDRHGKSGEFAIVIRRCAMGKGVSTFAMDEILRIGMKEMGLKKIYWCVSRENKRAIRFYDRNAYPRWDTDQAQIGRGGGYTADQIRSYIWYLLEE